MVPAHSRIAGRVTGGGKVGLAVGPLLSLLEGVLGEASMTSVLIFGGVEMLLGTWMLASRMIKALAQDYSDLGSRRSIGLLTPSFVIAQIGIIDVSVART